jgi:hypothetical protein
MGAGERTGRAGATLDAGPPGFLLGLVVLLPVPADVAQLLLVLFAGSFDLALPFGFLGLAAKFGDVDAFASYHATAPLREWPSRRKVLGRIDRRLGVHRLARAGPARLGEPLGFRGAPRAVRPLGDVGHLVPGASVKEPAAGFRGPAAPLLEEERHSRCLTLVAQVGEPRLGGRARVGTGFAAGDDPADPGQVQVGQRSEQGFAGQEPQRGGHPAQVINPTHHLGVLDRHPDPHVRWPGQLAGQAAQPGRALGQHLVGVLGRGRHDLEHPRDELDRHPSVE